MKKIIHAFITLFLMFFMSDLSFADMKIDPDKITFSDSSTQTTAGAGSGQWTTNGTKIYYNDGHVGIGTTTPDELLEVYGSSNPRILVSSPSGTPEFNLKRGSETWGLWMDSDDDLHFFQDGTKVTFSDNGNVGIGQSNPSHKLEVDDGNILVQGSDSFDSPGDQAVLYLGDTNNYILANHSNYVRIATAGTNKTITLNKNGYVGILMNPNSSYQSALQLKGAMHLFCATNSQANALGTDADGRLVFYANADLLTPRNYMDDDTGNFGIGEPDPQDPLHIIADSSHENIFLEENSGGEYWQIGVDGNGNMNFKENGTTRITFKEGSDAKVGIGYTDPTYQLQLAGSAYKSDGSASWAYSSDARLKDIIGEYRRGLEDILALRAVNYVYKPDNPRQLPSDEEHIGFVAQEVEPFFPEAIHEREDGYLDFDIHPINVAMINAIQELKKECDRLKIENESLYAKNELLKKDILQIKEALGL